MGPLIDRSKLERVFMAMLLILLVGAVALPFRSSCPSKVEASQRCIRVVRVETPVPPVPPLPPLPPVPPAAPVPPV